MSLSPRLSPVLVLQTWQWNQAGALSRKVVIGIVELGHHEGAVHRALELTDEVARREAGRGNPKRWPA
jgi:hypothetical protein